MRIGRSRCLPGLVVLTLSLSAPLALTQDRPSFEVVSVRSGLPSSPFSTRPARARSNGQFDAADTLRRLIAWAFQPDTPNTSIGRSPIEGSFKELDEVFVIAAKASGPVLLARPGEVGPMNQMLQSLLAERFKLQVRWETRSFPVHVLRRTTTDRLGRNLKRMDATCPEGDPENLNGAPEGCLVTVSGGKTQIGRQEIRGIVPGIADFARLLSALTGRRFVDETGLQGRFDLTVTFQDSEPGGYRRPLPEEDFSSLRDALRDDLGFKVESERRDFPVLIVEHIEQPTEN
jgi:uncharacterized protein (TIGR03435 family)